uniref:Kinetochore protein NDC80 n=1 Tax=Parascaris univalens TaxID=6257 RepID=A0A914ZUC0_PARUN
MSSFFKRPKKQVGFKDTRNLVDREVQASVQCKILDFLVASNYSMANEKLVRSPTRSDSAQMFAFIMLQLDPQYTFQGKVEEEMPCIMKNLGYPVQLKPSTMQTIGAPPLSVGYHHLAHRCRWCKTLANYIYRFQA